MKNYDYLVIGAGLTGCTFARQKAEEGKKVLLVEKRDHLAGNAYDYVDERTGLLVHKYGPHLFHTNSKMVYDFLSQFTSWRTYEHRVRACLMDEIWNGPMVPGSEYWTVPLPVNFETIRRLGQMRVANKEIDYSEEQISLLRSHFNHNSRFTLKQLEQLAQGSAALNALWVDVYNLVFKKYTEKMWECSLDELGPAVADRVPLIAGDDDRYFADQYQCMPTDGYTEMVRRMVHHRNITVRLGAQSVPEMWSIAQQEGKMFYTGPIDEFFDFAHGRLPYRGMSFFLKYVLGPNDPNWRTFLDMSWEHWHGASTVNYPNRDDFTRVSSMSRISGNTEESVPDVRVVEMPSEDGRYYPVPKPENRDLYYKYEAMSVAYPNIHFAGRLGSYQYLNMDQAVAQALKAAKDF